MKPPVFDPVWPEEIKMLYKHDMEQTWDPSLMPHLFNEYRYMLECCRKFCPKGKPLKVLDVGCAQATLALMLAEAGHAVTAVDIRQSFLDYAATRYEKGDIRFVCGNALELVFDDRFDLIFSNQMIEHLIYPLELLQRLKRWLKPGGRLVVSTPNADYIKNTLPSFSELGESENYIELQNSADGDGHFYAYQPGELAGLFETAGFSNSTVSAIESPWISGHMKFRFLHRLIPYELLTVMDNICLRIPWVGKKLSYQLLATGELYS